MNPTYSFDEFDPNIRDIALFKSKITSKSIKIVYFSFAFMAEYICPDMPMEEAIFSCFAPNRALSTGSPGVRVIAI